VPPNFITIKTELPHLLGATGLYPDWPDRPSGHPTSLQVVPNEAALTEIATTI
jgi:hypothetical protein